jgi:NCAIR mutase (PurE)-related protein
MNPFDHLRDALSGAEGGPGATEVRPDTERARRAGTPEVVLAAGKSAEQVMAAVNSLIRVNGRVVISRLGPTTLGDIRPGLEEQVELSPAPGNRAALASLRGSIRPCTGGKVAVISAGTSDIAVAEEAALMAAEMGCEVHTSWDVGVAGLHRLVQPVEQLVEWDADVFVVAAGMDGVLPTVISGLVAQPVIGLPVSTGYGFGGEGLGALTTMLQSCAPGIAVVNIDNGIGAGAMAAQIANRAARFRQAPPPTTP